MHKVSHRSIVDTNPVTTVSNSQPAGIGRLVSDTDFLFINNLGRNIEISRPANKRLEPRRFSFVTRFPDDDEKSQFDLDIHAFVVSPDRSKFCALNHYGYIRVFNLDVSAAGTVDNRQAELLAELKWPGDVERFQFLDNCFISTSPAGYAVTDPPESGILISSPLNITTLHANKKGAQSTAKLSYEKHLEDWGRTTAFKVSSDRKSLAVAADSHLGLLSLERNANGFIRPGALVWETELSYSVRHIEMFDCNRKILAAGVLTENGDGQGNDTEWSHLSGGHWTVCSTDNGIRQCQGNLDADIAWGNGGTALLLYDQSTLIGIDRHAGLYAWNINDNCSKKQLLSSPAVSHSLGIAHLIRHRQEIFCGFNRGGYRLWRYSFS